jgi:hypothetical protein
VGTICFNPPRKSANSCSGGLLDLLIAFAEGELSLALGELGEDLHRAHFVEGRNPLAVGFQLGDRRIGQRHLARCGGCSSAVRRLVSDSLNLVLQVRQLSGAGLVASFAASSEIFFTSSSLNTAGFLSPKTLLERFSECGFHFFDSQTFLLEIDRLEFPISELAQLHIGETFHFGRQTRPRNPMCRSDGPLAPLYSATERFLNRPSLTSCSKASGTCLSFA